MKTLLTIIIVFTVASPLIGQENTDLSNMSAPEIRELLLNQNISEEAKTLTQKHNKARSSAYAFLLTSVILGIVSGEASNPEKDNSGSILLGFGAGMSLIVAGISGIKASEHLKNAKQSYLSANSGRTGSTSFQMRNEQEILKSIFKYPTPR